MILFYPRPAPKVSFRMMRLEVTTACGVSWTQWAHLSLQAAEESIPKGADIPEGAEESIPKGADIPEGAEESIPKGVDKIANDSSIHESFLNNYKWCNYCDEYLSTAMFEEWKKLEWMHDPVLKGGYGPRHDGVH
jgi:hypothetical protein